MTLVDRIEAAQSIGEAAIELARSLDRIDELARWSIDNPTAYAQTLIRLEAIRGLKSHVARWARAIGKRADEIEESRQTQSSSNRGDEPESLARLLKSVQPDSPLESPPGYKVGALGVEQNDALVMATPCVIIGHMVEIESGEVAVELAWLDLGRWRRTIVPRSVITDRNKIGRLADLGVDVASENAADVVMYLRAFEIHNRANVPRLLLSRRCGWIGTSFLRGHHSHGDPNLRLAADAGLARIAAGLDSVGTLEEWSSLVTEYAACRPSLLLAVYAALAAPLLEVVGAPGFVVDWSGPSGRGKSTALDLACSVWGDPERYRQGWDTSSSVGPQELAAFLCHLPLVMDDTNRVDKNRRSLVAHMLYAIPSGLERLRGQKQGGLRASRTWQTILISSGEQPITTYAEGNAGAKRRTLCITGAPMGSVSEANSRIAKIIQHGSRAHYGTAGATFAGRLWSTPRESLKGRHAQLVAKYDGMGVGSTDRSLGVGVAVIELASELARDFLQDVTEGERLAAIALAWQSAVDSGADSDEPLEALRELVGWLMANVGRLYRGQGGAPQQGYIGAMRSDGDGQWIEVSVLPTEARSALDRWGRRGEYCISEWGRRGMLVLGSTGRTLPRSLGPAGGQPRQYVFSRETLIAEGVLDG